MKKAKLLTEEQWWAIAEYTSEPEPLVNAELEYPFLYVAGWGVFYPGMGYHQILMANIYAFEKGFQSGRQAREELEMTSEEMAEKLLQEFPVAWRSSVGRPTIFGNKLLNYAERSFLHGVEFV